MKIEDYAFGSIKIDGEVFHNDLWIIDGSIKKRDKSIAKSKFGTSHRISRKELKRVMTSTTRRIIIGSGNSGLVSLTNNAQKYLEEQGIEVEMYKTGELIQKNIEIRKTDAGIIHLTC
ncbi:MAG: MTH938/NDUFAF3 family protein [Candidatus Aminicenantaceae bacterium]